MPDRYLYPYRYERSSTVAALRERFEDLEPGAESGFTASIAGRLKTTREHGKVAFADIEDVGGRMQLFARLEVLGDEGMAAFTALNVGDIVGAEGEVVKTRRGELSLRVVNVVVLAKCRRPMPDDWHGMTDIEARLRQRYLDLLGNQEARRAVVARSEVNAAIRSFLEHRGFLEVETPLLQPIAGGAVARPFVTHHNALDIDLYLRIAPELYLKRLLIGGFERVYELNRSFRNEGISPRHNPEFTMLEAYEAYVDYEDTMTLVEDLVRAIAAAVPDEGERDGALVPDERFRRITMFEAIEEAAGKDLADVWDPTDGGGLREVAKEWDVHLEQEWTPGKVLAEVFEAVAEKQLNTPTFVVGFPKDVSPLAKDHRTLPGFTEQSDLIMGGVEIAPIYSELNDPDEQRARFEQQAAARGRGDEEAQLPDLEFVEALFYGMPPAGGFGLGVDRLLTLLLGAASLREVIVFPTLRPDA